MTAILRTEEVVVRFGVLQAVSQASIEVIEGRVTGLIGPNGAGKTTLFNVITGLQEPTSGKVFFEGKDITNKNPFKRARMGIARTFQKLEVSAVSLHARTSSWPPNSARPGIGRGTTPARCAMRSSPRSDCRTFRSSWWARFPLAPPVSWSWPEPWP